jgi:anti-anti-sigma regulatory factor
MLRITVIERPDELTFQLEGRLAGPWVGELEKCWHGAAAERARRNVRIELESVSFIDANGKQLLKTLHGAGANLIASCCLMKAVATEIREVGGQRTED